MVVRMNRLSELDVKKLIGTGECEWIDFKEKHHSNKADLVHDVLCLANADYSGDRYLVIGIRDSDRTIAGVELDNGRRRSQEILNLIQNAGMNHVPRLEVLTVSYERHEVDLVVIKDMPEKPYFLLREYLDGDRRVRAGSVYLRLGDTNTPIDSTADDVRVESMYRQRFGIDRPPIERIKTYLQDTPNWRLARNAEHQQFFRYEPFPEFTLVEAKEVDENFGEPWVRIFPDNKASRDVYHLKYHGTILDTVYLVWCDGGRYLTVMPQSWASGNGGDEDLRRSFYFVKGSIQDMVNAMVQAVYPNQDRHVLDFGFALFESERHARELLTQDLAAGAQQYTYYRHDRARNNFFQITDGQEHRLFSS